MKLKYIYIFIVLCITQACSIKEDERPSFLGDVVFYAKNGDLAESKTLLQSDGNIKWCPNDQINLFYGESSFMFASTNTQESSEVEFHGSLDGIQYSDDGEYWAVYPYGEQNTYNGESVSVTLPAEQVAVAGSFADDLYISIAKTKDYNLQFYNVCGGVRFSITQNDVEYITFRGNNNEAIAGKARIGWDKDGKPVVKSVINPVSEITLRAPDGGAFESGKWYYIVCYPATLAYGYSLTLNTKHNAHTTRKNNNTVIIKRSVWGSLEDADLNLVYDIPQNEIWYTTTDNKPLTSLPYAFKYIDPSDDDYNERAILQSNTYEDGLGILRYDEPIVNVGYYSSDIVFSTLRTIVFPSSMTSIGRVGSSFPNLELATFTGTLTEDYSYWNPFPFSPKLKYSGPNAEIIPNFLVVGQTLVSYAEGCGLAEIEISGYPYSLYGVNKIGSNCFSGNNTLTRVTIEAPICNIGQKAFYHCASLTSVSINSGVSSILGDAFMGCEQLINVSLPTTLIEIGEDCFYGCKKLEKIILPSSLKYIGAGAFSSCGLTSIDIPSSVTGLGDRSFTYCPLDLIKLQGTTPPGIIWYSYDGVYDFNSWRPFEGSCPIYVPEDGLSAYINDSAWKKYENRFAVLPTYVDLGLSVKWGTFDLGADGVGAFGDVYSWGELEPWTESTTWQDYSYDKSPDVLPLSDDVANVKLGGNWRMPTEEETKELVANCTVSYETVNSVSCLKLTSKKNGQSIYLPRYRFYNNRVLPEEGDASYFWTASIYASYTGDAVFYGYDSNHTSNPIDHYNRYGGFAIRPVWSDNSSGSQLVSNEPVDLGLSVKWASCNLGASKPEEYGDYYAWGETEPYYTEGHSQDDPCSNWRTRTNKPITGYNWESYKWNYSTDSFPRFSRYNSISSWGVVDNKTVFQDYDYEDDAAREALGGKWRTPTKSEWSELLFNCTWLWTSNYSGTGVRGMIVTSNIDGYKDKSIFLPAAGGRAGKTTQSRSVKGQYWSSAINASYPDDGMFYYFSSSGTGSTSIDRYNGFSIRPVTE